MRTKINFGNLFYTTCTIIEWYDLLIEERNVEVILSSFRFHVNQGRIIIYGFVIMPNHFHILYEVVSPFFNSNIKQSLQGFTSKELLKSMSKDEKYMFCVEKSNRRFQIWKSPSLSVPIFSDKFIFQKLNYIHNNPKKAGLVKDNFDYRLCSYRSYKERKSEFDFLTLLNF